MFLWQYVGDLHSDQVSVYLPACLPPDSVTKWLHAPNHKARPWREESLYCLPRIDPQLLFCFQLYCGVLMRSRMTFTHSVCG